MKKYGDEEVFTFSYYLTLSKLTWIYPNNGNPRGKLWKMLADKLHVL